MPCHFNVSWHLFNNISPTFCLHMIRGDSYCCLSCNIKDYCPPPDGIISLIHNFQCGHLIKIQYTIKYNLNLWIISSQPCEVSKMFNYPSFPVSMDIKE